MNRTVLLETQMFTGIVEEAGRVVSVSPKKLVIGATDILPGMKFGDSIAVNGICLTVTSLAGKSFSVDVMPETLRRSALSFLEVGDRVNLERALPLGGRLGGHLVQGHVDATGRLVDIAREGEAMILRFEAPPEVMRYVVEKGFIAVDGISLTIISRDSGSFQVSLVDYTRQHTTLGDRRLGDAVNLEVDIIAKYVGQLNQPQREGVTVDFLAEHGFLVR